MFVGITLNGDGDNDNNDDVKHYKRRLVHTASRRMNLQLLMALLQLKALTRKPLGTLAQQEKTIACIN